MTNQGGNMVYEVLIYAFVSSITLVLVMWCILAGC